MTTKMTTTQNDEKKEFINTTKEEKKVQNSYCRRGSIRMISKTSSCKFSHTKDTESLFSTTTTATAAAAVDHENDENIIADEYKCQGPYKHIRQKLDYGYHRRYIKERQWLQDSIIDKLLHEVVQNNNNNKCQSLQSTNKLDLNHSLSESNHTHLIEITTKTTSSSLDKSNHHSISQRPSALDLQKLSALPTDPWLVYIVGTHLISKSSAISTLFKSNHFPILSFVLVDPMEIQGLLPEYQSYIHEYGVEKGIELMTNETGYIAEILTRAALQSGTNVIVYTTFQSDDWNPKHFRILREELSQLKIGILHVISDKEQVKDIDGDEKSNNHHDDTATVHFIDRESQRIHKTVEKLIEHVDFHCLLKMTSKDDQVNIDIQSQGVTWETFYHEFQQDSTSAYQPLLIDEIINRRGENGLIQMFDVLKSTEENHQSNDMKFYGPYAHLRKTLDYTYHKNYKKERQRLQDAIISDTLDAPILVDHSGQVCTTPTEPFLVFTAAMGAGKSHTLNYLQEQGHFPLTGFVMIDPDQIRQHLPEFSLYVAHNKLTAGELTRKEAGYVVEILTLAALQSGKNVLVDTSLRDHQWYQLYFQRIRKEYPRTKLSILYVDAPREAVFARAEARGKITGRVVPKEVLEDALVQVPESVEILRDKVDVYCAVNNAPGKDVTLITEGMTWEKFKNLWIQTCAWIPKERKRMKIATNNDDSTEHNSNVLV